MDFAPTPASSTSAGHPFADRPLRAPNPLREAAAISGLILGLGLAVAVPELERWVQLHTPRGRVVAALALGLLTVLLVLAVLGLRPWIARVIDQGSASRRGRKVRWITFVVLWAMIAIPLGRGDQSWPRLLFGTATHWLGALAGLACTVALAERLRRGLSPAPHTAAASGPSPLPTNLPPAWSAALAALGLALLLGHFALEGMPHVPDEVAYRFDAATLAHGRRFAAPPPFPAAFPPPDWIELEADRAYGVFPIGWPLLLAPFVRLGAPWLANPLLTGLLVLAIAWLVAQVGPAADGPRRASRAIGAGSGSSFTGPTLAAWLAATSPFLLGLGASSMSHPAAVLAATVALAALLAVESRSGVADPGPPSTPRSRSGSLAVVLALASGGALVLVRPIEGVALGAAALWDGLAERRPPSVHREPAPRRWTARRAGLLALSGGLALGALALAADQARVTGNPFLPPVTQYFERHLGGAARNRLGFGPDVGLEWDATRPGHSPAEALVNLWRNAHGLERELLGWPAGSLVLALVGLLAGGWNRGERLLARHGACVIALYALYWYHGTAYGPRFLSALAPGLIVFSCRGAAWSVRALGTRSSPPPGSERIVRLAIAISLAAALAIHLPIMARYELWGLRGVHGALRRAVDSGPTPGLLFVAGARWPDYGPLYFLNAPDFQGRQVIALARGAALDSAVAAAYPGREVVRVTAAPAGP